MAELTTRVTVSVVAKAAQQALESLKREFRSVGEAAKAADAAGGQANRTRAALQSVASQLTQIRQLFFAVQGAQAAAETVRGIFAQADAYAQLQARLRLASSGQKEFNDTFQALRNLADRNLAPLRETVQTYTRVHAAVKVLGGGMRETLGITEAVTLALRISGATAEEQASSLLQFAQGLTSNFQGDEFRALTENAPRLLQAVADGMGRSTSELKGLSSAGKLTADIVSNALLKSLQQLRAEAGNLPVTVGGAFQVLQNAALEYVGSTDQARGSSRALASVILEVAKNFKVLADTLALVVAGVAALGIGRLVAALAGLVTTGGAVAGVFARIVGVLGGPVGLIASLAVAAAGFATFGAKSAGVADNLEDRIRKLKEETAALRRENEALMRGDSEPAGGPDPVLARIAQQRAALEAGAPRGNERFRDRQLAQLEREAEARGRELSRLAEAERESDAERARRGRLRGLDEAPKSIEDATKGLATRTNILKEFEQRSKDINNAFAVAFRRALEEGNAERAREVLAQQREAQAAAAKERNDALAGLAGAGNGFRLPQLQQEFDAVAKLTKDRLDREREELDASLREQLISVRGYYDERRRIADDEAANDVARLTREREFEQRTIQAVTAERAKAKDESQRQQADERLFQAAQKIREINAEIEVVQSRRLTQGRLLALEQAGAERELAANLAQVRERLAEIAGTGGGDNVRARLEREFRPLIAQLEASGDRAGAGDVRKLIDLEGQAADLQRYEREFNAALTRMRNAEQSIQVQRTAGLITESQARSKLVGIQQQTAAEVEGLIPKMEALAAAIPGDEARNRVGSIKVEFERLKTVVDDVAVAVDGTVRDAFTSFFEDIARGGKSAKDIMLDLFRAIEQGITRIAAQKVSDALFGGSGGGIGAIVSSLLGGGGGGGATVAASAIAAWADEFHGGGVVGAGGRRRRIDPRVFLAAPRLHSGGMLGLAPGEVPAVLQTGEEVLSRRDPRNSRNGGGVNVNMTVVTQDANSFQRSQGQIMADLARGVGRARRNL